MKKNMVFIFVIVLMLAIMTGCGNEKNNGTAKPTPSPTHTLKPEDDNGIVKDDDGIIGDDKNGTDSDILPEVGQDIENGVDDALDDAKNALDGNNSTSRNRR